MRHAAELRHRPERTMTIKYSIVEPKNLVSITAAGVTSREEWEYIFLALQRDTRRRDNRVKWAFLVSRSISFDKAASLARAMEKENIDLKAFYDTP